MRTIRVIDSHTGGEPTRLVIDGGPDLGTGPMADRLAILREQHDWLRSAVVNEPRGSDVIVGALLGQPSDPSCIAGVIFFNNVGYLGMCGHGTIGLMASLSYLGHVAAGTYRVETPVGIVEATLQAGATAATPGGAAARPYLSRVSVRNVPSYRYRANVAVQVDGIGRVTGDVAYGGNWFFLINDHGQTLKPTNIQTLTRYTGRVKDALEREDITGVDGAEIDHIELFGPSQVADSRSFVLCPGSAYDRSPCGTGTSAKLACLASDDKLKLDQVWRQESIIGSVFEASYEIDPTPGAVPDVVRVIPTITGEAYVTADATLVLDDRDPFRTGIRH